MKKRILILACVWFFLPWAISFAQEEKIKENWKDLQELWSQLREEGFEEDEEPPFPLDPFGGGLKIISDGKLKLYTRMAKLFQKVGFFEKGAPAQAKALKRIFKIIADPPSTRQGPVVVIIGPGGERDRFRRGFERFEDGLDSEDSEDVKKGLKMMKVFRGVPKGKRDRIVELVLALAADKPYPEPK